MTISYIGLWKLLLEKGLQKQDLVEHAGLSSATVAKMGKGEPVSNKVLDKICKYLDCSVNDIISYLYLIGMEERNRRNMLRILGSDQEGKVSLLLDYAERHGDIADPWYTGDFTTTYSDIVRGCEGFLTFLEQEGKL